MRRKMVFLTSGQYNLNRIYHEVRSYWPEALWACGDSPSLCLKRVYSPKATHFYVYQSASSLSNADREGEYGNGTLEFRLDGKDATIWAMPGKVTDRMICIFGALINRHSWLPQPNQEEFP